MGIVSKNQRKRAARKSYSKKSWRGGIFVPPPGEIGLNIQAILTLPHIGGANRPPNYFSRIVPLTELFRPQCLLTFKINLFYTLLWKFHGHRWKIDGAMTFSPKVVWHKLPFTNKSLYIASKFQSALKSWKILLLT